MNINKEHIDDLNVVLFVQIVKDDYESKVNEVLRDYRRKANMPGFRPGKVPEGLIRKMYGRAILIDEINKVMSESLQNYIKEQELHLLGDPLPRLNMEDLDWEIGNDFTFEFEIGLAPKIDVKLSKDDQLNKYQIIVNKEIIDGEVNNYAKRHGQYVDSDVVADFSEKLSGDIVQLDADGQPTENGLSAEDTSMLVSLINGEELKKPFENAKNGDEIVFNLSESFPNEWEIASILKKKDKSEVGDITSSQFKFTVKAIQKFVTAELNQELFDKVFGEGAATNINEFEELIKKSIAAHYDDVSMSKLKNDIREYYLEKINPQLPEEFLRKWLTTANKEASEDVIEKEFPLFIKNMKWEIIAKNIIKQHELKVGDDELVEQAKTLARRQFAMYGITNIPAENLDAYAMNFLKEEKNIHDIASQVLENKLADTISETIKLNIQEISMEDFNNMIYSKSNSDSDS